ncbi:MAG: glycosyltransferase [Chloroflexi bacterium]|nr:glycosyltransferase [Chloroflexota bacterium]
MMQNYDKPLVSIGLPVYNGERFIRQALDSLLAQEYGNFELIVSDNASADRTGEICQQYILNDKRIQYLRSETNRGGLWNFKRTLELASGTYFMWAAHDDMWLPDFVSSLAAELEVDPGAGIAMSATQIVDQSGKYLRTVRFDGDNNPNLLNHFQLLLRLIGWGRAKTKYNFYIYGLFRRELLARAIGFLEDTYVGDRLFISHMALATRFRYVDRLLYIRTEQALSPYERYPDENFARLAHEPLWRSLKPALQLGRAIVNSRLVPFHRKLYAPIAMWGMLRLLMRVGKPA